MNLINMISEAIETDDSNKLVNSKQLESFYDNLNDDSKIILDAAFIHLCGYSLNTLINQNKKRDENESK